MVKEAPLLLKDRGHVKLVQGFVGRRAAAWKP